MKLLRLYPFILLLLSCTAQETEEDIDPVDPRMEIQRPQNIILLIGDGMGLAQISSLFAFGENTTNFNRFEHIGLINTSSFSHKITDSAAGATAFACGKKTFNGAIGVDHDTVAMENIISFLQQHDWKTGLVVTSAITHATPAAFYAHVPYRKMEEEIAKQLVHSGVDIFIGGGEEFFNRRKDKVNYLDSLQAKGYLVNTRIDKRPLLEKSGAKRAFLLDKNRMLKRSEGRNSLLKEASTYSITQLSRTNKPFFMMIEGSQIDWAGHQNDHAYLLEEMKDFDETIGAVLDFAKADGNTLVLVTADHETGGYALTENRKGEVQGVFSTEGHTASLVPVFAFGPGAELFTGIYENTDIYHKIKRLVR